MWLRVKVEVGSWTSAGDIVEVKGCYLGASVIPGCDWVGPRQEGEGSG